MQVLALEVGSALLFDSFALLNQLLVDRELLFLIVLGASLSVFALLNLDFKFSAHSFSLLLKLRFFLFCFVFLLLDVLLNDCVPLAVSHSDTFVAGHGSDNLLEVFVRFTTLRHRCEFLAILSVVLLLRVVGPAIILGSVRFKIVIVIHV